MNRRDFIKLMGRGTAMAFLSSGIPLPALNSCGIQVQFLGRNYVTNSVAPNDRYLADIYRSYAKTNGQELECFTLLDAKLVDLTGRDTNFVRGELSACKESIMQHLINSGEENV